MKAALRTVARALANARVASLRVARSETCIAAIVVVTALGCSVQLRAAAAREWTPEIFDYDRPLRLEVAEKGEPQDGLPGTRQRELTFRNLDGEQVPVLLTFPRKGKGPFPAVLLVHPLGGDRRQMTREMGKALTDKGFACVAMDLPFHGDRAVKGKAEELFAPADPRKAYANVVGAIRDIRQTIDLAKERKDLGIEKGMPLVGYSLGAWFGTLAGSADRRVSILILQGAGTGVETEAKKSSAKNAANVFEQERNLLLRHPTLRPATAIAEFAPRSLLMQNGKKDPFISEESARSLYRAARAPKELRWYDCGHILPEKAAVDAAEWIVKNRD